MPSESGYSNQKKKGQSQFKTINQVGSGQFGNPISQKTLFDKTPSAIAITAVTDILGSDGLVEFWQITLPAHSALKNDVLRMISGTLLAWEYDIIQVVDVNNFYILPISDTKPQIADTAKVLGWVTSKSSQEGELVVVISPSPVVFVLDGIDTEVEEDTATPANNKPLPIQQFIYKDGVQIPITKDTGTPANTVGMPVEIVAASGTPINITAGDLNVQLSDLGVNFDATRIGDGTGNYLALGQTISADAVSVVLSTEQEAILAQIDSNVIGMVDGIGDIADSAISNPLSPGSVISFLKGILAESQLKADLSETQPISAVSLPLPTGASIAANQIYAPVGLSLYDFASANVTSLAYFQVIASAPATRKIQVFMSSGEPLYLAFGAIASEVNQIFIIPGGNGLIDLVIPAATRVSIKAVNVVTVSSGVLLINYLG